MENIIFKDLLKWKGENTYYGSKTFLGGYNQIWKKYAGRNWVGSCSTLYKKLQPTNCEDFFYKYLADGDQERTENSYDYGRNIKELYELSVRYKTDVEKQNHNQYPVAVYFNNIVCHVICETFYGQKKENDVITVLENKGYHVSGGNDDDDTLRNIDLMVYGKVKKDLKCFLQIKPHTTFKGNTNLSLIEDRKHFFEKHDKGNIKYPNIPYYYVLYNSNTNKWLYTMENETKVFKFTLDMLCDQNGLSKVDVESLFQTDDLFS